MSRYLKKRKKINEKYQQKQTMRKYSHDVEIEFGIQNNAMLIMKKEKK